MSTFSLDGVWQLTYGPQGSEPAACPTIPATVPGNVELDLMAAGVLPELAYANNIYLLREYEGYQWWYRRSFEAPATEPGETVQLVFEGSTASGRSSSMGSLSASRATCSFPTASTSRALLREGDKRTRRADSFRGDRGTASTRRPPSRAR